MTPVQEQPKKAGALRKIFLVLRLIGAAPGILMAANREYKQFKNAFLEQATAEGMPEALARDIMAEYRPMRVFRDLSTGRHRQEDEA